MSEFHGLIQVWGPFWTLKQSLKSVFCLQVFVSEHLFDLDRVKQFCFGDAISETLAVILSQCTG